MQAKLAEKLGGVFFDGLRTRFHATRALVYLGHLDMVKMSLFDPYPSDGDSVLWSDESSSSTARYARFVPSPSSHEICSDSMGVVGGCGYGVVIGGCGYYRCTIVKCCLSSSMPILLLGPLFCIKDVPFTPALLSPWMICVGLCCVHCCVLSYLLLPSVTFPW